MLVKAPAQMVEKHHMSPPATSLDPHCDERVGKGQMYPYYVQGGWITLCLLWTRLLGSFHVRTARGHPTLVMLRVAMATYYILYNGPHKCLLWKFLQLNK